MAAKLAARGKECREAMWPSNFFGNVSQVQKTVFYGCITPTVLISMPLDPEEKSANSLAEPGHEDVSITSYRLSEDVAESSPVPPE
jgi:hypothetical protein